MKRLAAIALLAAAPGLAHRLDEYLQGTLISVEKSRLEAYMTLTPGIAVLPIVLAAIDTDADGIISEDEQRAYAARVLRDLSLTLDGSRLEPRLVSIKFPAAEEMKEGRGAIQLTFNADLPAAGSHRKLVLENHHQGPIAAYQVNCLIARDPDIHILAQHRNYSQSHYELDYDQAGGGRGWLAALALLLFARFGLAWRRARTAIVPAFLACIIAATTTAKAAPRALLLVLSKGDHTLAMVDPESHTVLARMPSGPDPHEVVASPDGKFAYISNYGAGAYSTLTIVDLQARKTLSALELSPLRGPHGLDFAGGKVWFTAETNKVIGSYDPAAAKVDWILGTGQNRTHMIYVASDLSRIITTNVSSASVSIIDKIPRGARGGPPGAPPFDWDETVVPVGRGAEGFDVSPGGKELWTAGAQDGTISIIDLAGKKRTETLPANVKGANRLKFTPDGKLALVSILFGPDLVSFDVATRREVKRVKIGSGAAGIQMQPDGARAYVACTPDSYVAIIDLKSLEVAGHIEAGKNPDGLAWIAAP